MSTVRALASGLAGACALTAIHQTARGLTPDAPRMDVLGMRAIDRSARAVGVEPPAGANLYAAAMGGDILFNSLYYSLVGMGGPDGAWLRGAALGLTAGVGAVLLPGPLGLGTGPSRRTPQTALMTVALYLAGGLAAAAACRALDPAA